MSNTTLDFYDTFGADYISSSSKLDMSKLIEQFSALGGLKKGDQVLDAGCGSGRDSIYMQQVKGFNVSAFDASASIVNELKLRGDLRISQLKFEDFDEVDQYQGIWCCASLLHVPLEHFEDVLSRLSNALKSDGILYFSIKTNPSMADNNGFQSWSDHLGRFFYNVGDSRIKAIAEQLNLNLLLSFENEKIGDSSDTFVNYFFKKQ